MGFSFGGTEYAHRMDAVEAIARLMLWGVDYPREMDWRASEVVDTALAEGFVLPSWTSRGELIEVVARLMEFGEDGF